MDFSAYSLWIFDCDGVLLESNRMKQAGFAQVLRDYPAGVVADFLAFQKTAFGLSRFRTIDAFFDRFLGRPAGPGEKEALLEAFGAYCRSEYPRQPVTPGAEALLHALAARGAVAYVCSGSAEDELRTVLEGIGLAPHFRAIYGSPRPKAELVAHVLEREAGRHAPGQALFLGDAEADYRAAAENGIAFLQVSAFAADPEGMARLRAAEGFPAVARLDEVTWPDSGPAPDPATDPATANDRSGRN